MTLDDYFLLFTTLFFLYISIVYLLLFLEKRRDSLADPKPTRFPGISVIVPAYNEADTIQLTLESIRALDYPAELEILVVDDGSTDDTAEKARRVPGVTVLSKENGGKGSALNFGLKHAKHDVVGVVDADSFVRADALQHMVGHFDDEKVGAVSSSILVHEPKNLLQGVQFVEYIGMNYIRKNNALLDALFVTPGPLSLFRKKALREAGGFDENALSEDMEVALNLLSRHYKIRHSVNALVSSVSPHSFPELIKQRIRWYRGALMNARKYHFLFFNKEYRNLGLFVFPINFVIFGILAYLVYRAVTIGLFTVPVLLGKLSALNAMSEPARAAYYSTFLDPAYFVTLQSFLFLLSLGTFILYFGFSFWLSKERFRLSYIPFLAVYLTVWNLLVGVAFFIGLGNELRGAKTRW